VLYRERPGGESFGDKGITGAGAFSIQPLEGGRFGTIVLWVLNGVWEREDRGIGESVGFKHSDPAAVEGPCETPERHEGRPGALVALVFR